MINVKENPYIGLRPYTYEDRDKFFGRDEEKQILFDKILANKLTLLFAASGVGKSSLLRAGIIPELENKNYEIIYFFEWADQPELNLKQEIVKILKKQYHINNDSLVNFDLPLAKFLKIYQLFSEERLVIILDQFEEFFNYTRLKESFKPFIENLSEAIQEHDMTTIFVVSMREDFALELNAFKSYVSGFFDNFYRLEKLTKQAAQQAILKPLEHFGFKFEENLFERLLDDLSRREQIERYGLEQSLKMKDAPLLVEPPHLQIVCSQLWELESTQADQTIHYKIYEKHGKAQGFLKNHFISLINQLSRSEQKLASEAFDFLVNKHGTKIAYSLEDLSSLLKTNEKTLGQTLNKLEKARILRKTERWTKKNKPISWFEIYHDVFAKSIYEWNEPFKNNRRFRRFLKLGLAGIASLSITAIGLDVYLNKVYQYLYVDSKTSAVEIHQGHLNSLDIFQQRKFIKEIRFESEQLEIGKRNGEYQIVGNQVLDEVMSKLSPFDQVQALLDTGKFEEGIKLAKDILINSDLETSRKVISHLMLTRVVSATQLLEVIIESNSYSTSIKQLTFDVIKTQPSLFKKDNFKFFLIKILEKSNNDEIRSKIANILGQLNVTEATPKLISLLTNESSSNVRANIIDAIGIITPIKEIDKNKAIEHLMRLLSDSSLNVRLQAVKALGKLKATKAIPELIKILRHGNLELRASAVDALGELNSKEAIQPLLEQINLIHIDINLRIIEIFDKMEATEAIPCLILLVKEHSNNLVRANAIKTLAKLGAQDIVISLIEILDENDVIVRSNAIDALGELQVQEAIPYLIGLLNTNVRANVVEALSILDAKEAIPQLIKLLKDDSDIVREKLVNTLKKLDAQQEVIFPLIEILEDEKSSNNIRASASKTAGTLKLNETIPILIELLKNENTSIRLNAVEALGELDAKDAILPLINSLNKTNSDELQAKIVQALGKLKAHTALTSILNFRFNDNTKNMLTQLNIIPSLYSLNSFNKQVHNKIEYIHPLSMQQLGEQEIDFLSVIKEPLSSFNSQFDFLSFSELKALISTTGSPSEKAQAILAIGKLETPCAAEFLIKIGSEQQDHNNVFIIQALGNTKQKVALPYLTKKLKQIEDDKIKFRSLRQKGELEQQRLIESLKEHSYIETEIAYAISQIDPLGEGLKLLQHPLSEVRRGAWLGIGHHGENNLNILETLLKEHQNTDDGFNRFSIYRAIDLSLITLEKYAQKDDINRLERILDSFLDSPPSTTKRYNAIRQRFEWTINELKYRFNVSTGYSGEKDLVY